MMHAGWCRRLQMSPPDQPSAGILLETNLHSCWNMPPVADPREPLEQSKAQEECWFRDMRYVSGYQPRLSKSLE